MVAPSRTHFRSSEVARKGTPQYGRFDAVVLPRAPADVSLDQVARRTTNDYGKVRWNARWSWMTPPRSSRTHELGDGRPVDDVVAGLIAIASAA